MREDELKNALERWSSTEVQAVLDNLLDDGKAQIVKRYDVRFWSAKDAYYQDVDQI